MIRFGMLGAGLFFLFNPNINIIDVLPDAVGYFLILVSIGKLCDLCPELEDARSAFIRMFWISLAKLPALLLMFLDYGGQCRRADDHFTFRLLLFGSGTCVWRTCVFDVFRGTCLSWYASGRRRVFIYVPNQAKRAFSPFFRIGRCSRRIVFIQDLRLYFLL